MLDKGQEALISGTSASAPTFAGIVGLLNSARLAAGRPPMGFLNPWIYTVGLQGLTDIVDGGSTGCTGIDKYSGLKTVCSLHVRDVVSIVMLTSSSQLYLMPAGTPHQAGIQ